MRILALALAALLLVIPMASALTSSDEAILKKMCQKIVDLGDVKKFGITVQPPDEITFIILANSGEGPDIARAVVMAVSGFSILTSGLPEVNKGEIQLYWDKPKGYGLDIFEIYPSDLWPIKDRFYPAESEVSQVAITIMTRAK